VISSICSLHVFSNNESSSTQNAQSTCTRPLGEHQDCRGGTAARRDSVRVFRQFVWLKAGSGKMTLSRLTHQYPWRGIPTGCYANASR